MIQYLKAFVHLIFPHVCASCQLPLGKYERHLCTTCTLNLPLTGFHNISDNGVEKSFWGRIPIQQATAWWFFEKGSSAQQIIHHIKYHAEKELAVYMGKLFGHDLLNTPFAHCDVIVPVPLHENKMLKRGYNQAQLIAQGISQITNIPIVNNALLRLENTKSQTRQNRIDRWENIKNAFVLHDEYAVKNKHVLIVDDVLTTGATIEAVGNQLLQACSKISVATLAWAPL